MINYNITKLILLITFSILSLHSPAKSQDTSYHLIYGVPYEAQAAGSFYCGPACVKMMLGYWDKNTKITQDDIIKEVYNSFFNGTFPGAIENYLSSSGFIVETERGSSLEHVKEYINKDIPVLVINSMTSMDNFGHFRVIIGFDDLEKQITCHDPALGSTYKMSYDEFTKAWNFYKKWMMAFYPENYSEVIKNKISPGPYPERNSNMDGKVHIAHGRAYLLARYYYEAIKEFEEGMKLATDDNLIWNFILMEGDAFTGAGDFKKAENLLYSRGKDEIFNIPYGCYLLAKINYLKGNYDEGEKYALRSVDIVPDYGEAYVILGKCQEKLGHRELARISYERALQINLNLSEAQEKLKLLEER